MTTGKKPPMLASIVNGEEQVANFYRGNFTAPISNFFVLLAALTLTS